MRKQPVEEVRKVWLSRSAQRDLSGDEGFTVE